MTTLFPNPHRDPGPHDRLPQALAVSPIVVIPTSSELDSVKPGEKVKRGFIVQNRGDRDAVVDVHFDGERSPVLTCKLPHQRLALGQGQSGEIVFIMEVHRATLPGWLDYDLVFDATDSYINLPPWRKSYQLRVLPDEQLVEANHPTFLLTPQTSPTNPVRVRPGIPVPIELWVDNCSERVDRFRLSCLGLSNDWQIRITYPRDSNGSGLVLEADSLGLNPGDRGQILVTLTPPATALAGSYVPTLRLYSQNHPDLKLLGLVYLYVEPIYLLQPTLQILRNQVHRQPALFEVYLANTGNLSRTIRLSVENLDEVGSCTYLLKPFEEDDTRYSSEPATIIIPPYDTQRVRLQGIPQRWWRKPFFGGGRFLNFRVELQDTEKYPLALNTLQGNLLWLPRPWWQLLLAVLIFLGAIASLAFLIWWVFFRPPVFPKILNFATQDARYAAANQDSARVVWQIDHPERVKSLKLTGYSPEGTILSGPYTYDLTKALPSSLQPFCTWQDTVLWCENVETGARRPGQYQFELTVIPKGPQPNQPIAQRTNPIVIDPKPLPQITEFFPNELVYVESGRVAPSSQPKLPQITQRGIQLNWSVDHPRELATLKLVGRDAKGKSLGVAYYALQDGALPPELQPWCRLEKQLICKNVPTPVYDVGEYQFELTAIPIDDSGTEVKPKTTEIITIQPQASQILAFRVNGTDAQNKYRIPVHPGQPAPMLSLAWAIAGGKTTTATLSPVPGSIPLVGSVNLPLNPEPGGSTTFTLQVQDSSGKPFTRSVTIETYDPAPTDPNQSVANAITNAVKELRSSPPPPASPPPLGASGAIAPGVVSPSELPPQFGR
jgi:hypothetical protein